MPTEARHGFSSASKDGTFIKTWGKKGDGPGEFNVPHTIFFDSRGRLLVKQ